MSPKPEGQYSLPKGGKDHPNNVLVALLIYSRRPWARGLASLHSKLRLVRAREAERPKGLL